ncbi:ISL3 family transposase [Streptomyces sp. NPDC002306]
MESIKRTVGIITLRAGFQTLLVRCPGCGLPSWRVHGRYVRRLGDVPVSGNPVVIELTVRRFKCLSSRCPAVSFAEQIEGLTRPHGRQTQVLRSMLTSIALCLAGRPGVRLAAVLGIRIAKDALLDLLRSVPQPPVGAIRFLGVDDFALRKGDSYATILIDLEARRPVDVLPGRDAEPLAAWLRRHPEVEVICRDRAGAYAEGARSGAPQAMQVADAWHLWRNVADAVERTVGSHHGCIQAAFVATPVMAEATARDRVTPEPSRPVAVPFVPPDGTLDGSVQPRRLVARTTERYASVQALLAEGKSLAAIGRRMRLDHSTVRRFARAASLDELLVKTTGRLSVLDERKPHLDARWLEGCHDIPQLHRELRERGFTGSVQCLRRYFRAFRPPRQPGRKQQPVSRPQPRLAPKPRRVVRWITTHPQHLPAADAGELKEIRTACTHLRAVPLIPGCVGVGLAG